jgi:hypothetical protein
MARFAVSVVMALIVSLTVTIMLIAAAAAVAQQQQQRQLVGIPEIPRAKIWPIPACGGDGDDGANYRSPHFNESQIDEFFRDSLAPSIGDDAEEAILSRFESRTVLCVGCSKGIGRANVCHYAGRRGTERIISLAATRRLDPRRCPSGNSKIANVVYDIAEPQPRADLPESFGERGWKRWTCCFSLPGEI